MKLRRPTTHPLLPLGAAVLLILGLLIGFMETDYRPVGASLTCGSPFLTTDSEAYYDNGPIVPPDASIGVVASAVSDADRYAQLCDINLRGSTTAAWTLVVAGLLILGWVLRSAWPTSPLKRPPGE